MSWAGFKKNVNRATTQVMMKTADSYKNSPFNLALSELSEGCHQQIDMRSSAPPIDSPPVERHVYDLLDFDSTNVRHELVPAPLKIPKRAVPRQEKQAEETLLGEACAAVFVRNNVGTYEHEADQVLHQGHVERTNDRDYEIEERRYRTLEGASLRLQKESKGYLDALRAMTASQMRIAETIDAFYGDAGAKDGVSRSYKQAVEDLDAETIKALDGPYRTTVLEPIGKFCHYFTDVNECIKKRNHKLLDYDSCRAKVKKLVEKPDKDPTKLPRAERESDLAKQAYESLNEQLFTELPQLIDLRVPYLDPSFEALVKIQLRFCAEAYSRMAQVQQYLDADTRDLYAQGHLDQKVEQVLGEIRDLSISGTV